MDSNRSRLWAASQLFKFFEREHVRYCVMGDTRAYPQQIASDIDIVVEHPELKRIPALLQRFGGMHQMQLVQYLRHDQLHATFFVLAWRDSDRGWHFLQLDFSADYWHQGKLILTAQAILAARRPAAAADGSAKGFFVAAAAHEFHYYCYKKIIWKQSLSDEQAAHLSDQWARDPEGARAAAEQIWRDDALIDELAQAAAHDRWHNVRAQLARFARVPPATLGSWRSALGETLRLIERVCRPSGLFVAVIGPDGSGKSTVCEQLQSCLEPAFRRSAYFHWRARLGLSKTRADVGNDNPHDEAARSWIGSVAKLAYLCAMYWISYLGKIRPLLVRSALVVFDRYYHDMLVDPRRYRYGGPLALVRWVGKLVPKPDLWILLDAPTHLIHARKQEVPAAETERQLAAYRALAASLRNSAIVDGAPATKQVVAASAGIILRHLAERTAHRLKLADPGATSAHLAPGTHE